MTNNIKYTVLVIASIVLTMVANNIVFSKDNSLQLGGASASGNPTFSLASSTVYTLTTTSTRLLASSTPTKRVAALIQPINCTAGGTTGVFLNLRGDDIPATANTGTFAFGSSTLELAEWPNVPVIQDSVQGIVPAGTCTVLVTEWRSQF